MSTEHLRPADRAVTELGRRIGAGEWPVGAKLPGETSLAQELGVGRSTVREAVRVLATRGLVRSRQGAGVFVVADSMPINVAASVQRAGLAQVQEVRRIVEIDAAGLAAERRTGADIGRMRRALDARHDAASESDAAFVNADIDFHVAVVAAAHNSLLSDLFESFLPRLRAELLVYTSEVLVRPRGTEPDVDLHEALFDAIAAGDRVAAVSVAREHLV
ncbi:MAG: FadR/GntR family transcriptional regulator [Rhodococcus sp. (in: high G+C Gram-positive bacteria)]|nr:FadR/GntR family transcriptional regulator [Rhodococcus sp. (in: high G+C Gram-positive bacteria)]MDI6627795.1 FadR/GntR family transcriptional regulator [Rhodococcus sp. (in: high G+C Gram-positive bacteria)]